MGIIEWLECIEILNLLAMLYLFIFLFQFIGIGFQVAQKVREIDKRIPGDTFDEVLSIFLRENRVSLFLSALIIIMDEAIHLALAMYTTIPDRPVDLILFSLPFPIAAILFSLFLGYAGQWFMYFLFGKAQAVIEKKLEDKLNK